MRTIILVDIQITEVGFNYNKILPLGLAYLTGALKKNTRFKVLAFHIKKEQINKLVELISQTNPLFVAITSTLAGTKIIPELMLSRAIKQAVPHVPIVWGGILATTCPKLCLQEDCVDIVCLGDGEKMIVDLARAIDDGSELSDIPGLAYKPDPNGPPIYTENRPPLQDIDQNFPDFSFLDLDDYIIIHRGKRFLKYGFYPTRGCPFNCGFCYNSALTNTAVPTPFRTHSLSYLQELIRRMKHQSDFELTSFGDDNISLNKAFFFQMLDLFTREGVSPIHMQMTIDHLDEKDIVRLGTYPIEMISFGLESTLPRIRQLISLKKHDLQKIRQLIHLFDKHTDFELRTNIIGGFPTQTKKEMIKDIKQTISLSRWGSNLKIEYLLFTAYPQTAMTRLAHRKGFQEPNTLEEWSEQNHINVWFNPQPWLKWQMRKDVKQLYLIKKLISEVLYFNPSFERMGVIGYLVRWFLKLKFYFVRGQIFHFFTRLPVLQTILLRLAGRFCGTPLLYDKAFRWQQKQQTLKASQKS